MPTNDELEDGVNAVAPFLPLLAGFGYTGPTSADAVFDMTVGQFRAILREIPDLLRTVPATIWQQALDSTPTGPARTYLQQFASGNFSLIDDALDQALAAVADYPATTRLSEILEGLGGLLPFDYVVPSYADFGAPDALSGGGFTWETPAFTIDANGNWSYSGYFGSSFDGFDARGAGGLAGLWEGAANLVGAMYFEAIESLLRAAGVSQPARVATNDTNAPALMAYQETAADLMATLLGGTGLRGFALSAERQLRDAGREVTFDGDAFFDGMLRLVGYSVSQSDVTFGMHSGTGVRSFGDHRDTYLGGAGRDRVNLGGNDDRAFTLGGNDIVNAQGGNDRVFGGGGNDILRGGTGRDILEGGSGRDKLIGQSGNDRLVGQGGNDRLYGNSGHDRLFGLNGNDRLNGGAGNDSMAGGRGADDFIFTGGRDKITDFNAAQNDEIYLDRDALGLGGRTAAQVVNRFAEVENGRVVFDFGDGNTLTLLRVSSTAGLADDIVLI